MVPGVCTLVNGHPGTEESEELRVTIASRAAIGNMSSGLTNYVAWTLSGLTSRCMGMLGGTGQARVGGKMLLKDLVSFSPFLITNGV